MTGTELFKQVYQQGLKNAERWMKDAKLLMADSSFGHASAILRFAYEEIAKALVCWYVSEGFFPQDSKPVEDVFRKHVTKNSIILAMILSTVFGPLKGEEVEEMRERVRVFDKMRARVPLDKMALGMEKLRQDAIYVNLNPEKKRIMTPEAITEKEARGVLEGVEFIFEVVKTIDTSANEAQKQVMHNFFSSMPKEVWKTGEIPRDWLDRKMKGLVWNKVRRVLEFRV